MNMMEAKESRARHWLSYRSELKVLDCTLRDGGLMNDHTFDDDIVRAIYQANVDAGVDYMEMGYKADKKIFAPTDFGPWKFCDEEDVRHIVGENDTGLKLSVMADAETVSTPPASARGLSEKATRANRSSGFRFSRTKRNACFAWSIFVPYMLPDVSSTNTKSLGITDEDEGSSGGLATRRKKPSRSETRYVNRVIPIRSVDTE